MKNFWDKKFIISVVILGILLVIIFRGAPLILDIFKKEPKEEIIAIPQPQQEIQQEEKQTIAQIIEGIEEKLRKNPNDLTLRLQLAQEYINAGNIALALMEYTRIIEIKPVSNEADVARKWIDKQADLSTKVWYETFGKKFQETVALVEYSPLSPKLAAISQEVGRRMDVKPVATTTAVTPPVGIQYQPLTPHIPLYAPTAPHGHPHHPVPHFPQPPPPGYVHPPVPHFPQPPPPGHIPPLR